MGVQQAHEKPQKRTSGGSHVETPDTRNSLRQLTWAPTAGRVCCGAQCGRDYATEVPAVGTTGSRRHFRVRVTVSRGHPPARLLTGAYTGAAGTQHGAQKGGSGGSCLRDGVGAAAAGACDTGCLRLWAPAVSIYGIVRSCGTHSMRRELQQKL